MAKTANFEKTTKTVTNVNRKATSAKAAPTSTKTAPESTKTAPESTETAPKENTTTFKNAAESDDGPTTKAEPARKIANPKKGKAKVVMKPALPIRKKKAARTPRPPKFGSIINKTPTRKLNVYVFGEGTSGELGLGSVKIGGKRPVDVKRPRLNEKLSAEAVGIVQLACGGMHCAALTHDNRIFTWGVNDQGALGRETKWEGGLKEVKRNNDDDDEDSDSNSNNDDTGMNPLESNPSAVDTKYFPEDCKFVQLVASDSATFVLTEDGSVYGWGTFRDNEGILGFTEKIYVRNTPIKILELKKITMLAAGNNHILALDYKGNVFAWGAGQQYQLGRRVVERTRTAGLVPRQFGLPKNKIVYVACGAYHGFAMDRDGQVWSWGLNNFGETGIPEGAGEDNAVIFKPTIVTDLTQYKIKQIQGGEHHSVACTIDGKLLTWGRADGSQIGVKVSDILEDHLIHDEHGRARITKKPILVSDIYAVAVAAGSGTGFAIDKDGKAYSWGFSANYQTGLGTDNDVEMATLIDNTAVRGQRLVSAGAGGQYGVLMGIAKES